MSKFAGYLKTLPYEESFRKVATYNDDKLTLFQQNNTRKIPGYLKYSNDDGSKEFKIPIHVNLEQKIMATPYLDTQTGNFRGQPGVLYRFDNQFGKRDKRDQRRLNRDPIRYIPKPIGQLSGK